MLLSQISYSETCPSIHDLKQHNLHGWQAYDSDDDTLLSPLRFSKFIKQAEQFALAEWKNKNSTVHCYYRSNDGSELEAYLSKQNFLPINNKDFWYQVSGATHCAAGMDKCEFKINPAQDAKLARK